MKKYLKTIVLTICAAFAFILTVKWEGYNVYAADVIVPTYMEADGSTANANTYQYEMTEESGTLSIPVQITNSGAVFLEVSAQTKGRFSYVFSKSAVPNDKNSWLSYDLTVGTPPSPVDLSGYASGASTWYLHLTMGKDGTNQTVPVTVKAYQKNVLPGDGTLKKGKWASYYIEKSSSAYYKIKVPSTGCLTLEIPREYNGISSEITLLNSKKKKLTAEDNNEGKVIYAIRKKGTYYIKIENTSSFSGAMFKIRYAFEKIKVNKNTKKSKAVELKNGKASKGIFFDKKNSYWYKIKVPKTKTVKFNIPIKSSSGAGFEICNEKGETVEILDLKNGNNKPKVKLKQGIYYIEIYTTYQGSYSIQWN